MCEYTDSSLISGAIVGAKDVNGKGMSAYITRGYRRQGMHYDGFHQYFSANRFYKNGRNAGILRINHSKECNTLKDFRDLLGKCGYEVLSDD
jgi:hypothetical protein